MFTPQPTPFYAPLVLKGHGEKPDAMVLSIQGMLERGTCAVDTACISRTALPNEGWMIPWGFQNIPKGPQGKIT